MERQVGERRASCSRGWWGGTCQWRFVSFRLGKRGAAGLSQSGGLLDRRSAFLREEDRVDHGCVRSL